MEESKLIYGVGIKDVDYNVYKTERIDGKYKVVWKCPFYSRWSHMLERCYSPKYWLKFPTYEECSVCDEWFYLSNFKSWMETQDWEGKHLDKDLLVIGNRIYNPSNCLFVDPKINIFMIDAKANRGVFPLGVSLERKTGKFRAKCRSVQTNRQEHLGLFHTPEEAHAAWLNFKLEQAYILASEQTDGRVAKVLIDRYLNYNCNNFV